MINIHDEKYYYYFVSKATQSWWAFNVYTFIYLLAVILDPRVLQAKSILWLI